eukprot:PhF_6_TR1018/c0_g1_i1/m.2043/K11838/USP7, UBP15; ubiquitin carboxyl-terminal hydrolase 7
MSDNALSHTVLAGASTFRCVVDDNYEKHPVDEIYVVRNFSPTLHAVPVVWMWKCSVDRLQEVGYMSSSATVTTIGCNLRLQVLNGDGKLIITVGCVFAEGDNNTTWRIRLRVRLMNTVAVERCLTYSSDTLFTPHEPTVMIASGLSVLDDIFPESAGYNQQNTIPVELAAYIYYPAHLDDQVSAYVRANSRQAIGCVGLHNQGATCYLNSLLQHLFHLLPFRQIIYELEPKEGSIALALQNLFYCLEISREPVDTSGLTTAFGWTSADAFVQHDVEELMKLLFDHLERYPSVKEYMQQLFEGKVRRITTCRSVDCVIKNEESFFDIALSVRNRDIYGSFERECSVEAMVGPEQISTDKFGKQDADRHSTYTHLPPILYLHLRRYKYVKETQRMEKECNKFAFDDEIDLNRFVENSTELGKPFRYLLHTVLVHHGSGSSGHYEAFTCTRKGNDKKWYRFNDAWSVLCTDVEAVYDNFGGPGDLGYRFWVQPSSSAYMLTYVRKDHWDMFFSRPVQIPARFEKWKSSALKGRPHNFVSQHVESQQQKQHSQSNSVPKAQVPPKDKIFRINCCTLSDIEAQVARVGMGLFDFKTSTNHLSFEVAGSIPCQDFRNMCAQHVHLSGPYVRLWQFVKRVNGTFRPEISLVAPLKTLLCDVPNIQLGPTCEILIEPLPQSLSERTVLLKSEIAIHLKWYSASQGCLIYLGMGIFDSESDVAEVVAEAARRKKCTNTNLMGFEELEDGTAVQMSMKKTLSFYSMRHGDVIIAQQKRNLFSKAAVHATAIDYLQSIAPKLPLDFICIDDNAKVFSVEMHRHNSYEDATHLIGSKYGVHPDFVRLWIVGMGKSASHRKPITPADLKSFAGMANIGTLLTEQHPSHTIYFDILTVPINKTIGCYEYTITFFSITTPCDTIETKIKVFYTSKTVVSDIIKDVAKQTSLSKSHLVIYDVCNGRITQVLNARSGKEVYFQSFIQNMQTNSRVVVESISLKADSGEYRVVEAIDEKMKTITYPGFPFVIPYHSLDLNALIFERINIRSRGILKHEDQVGVHGVMIDGVQKSMRFVSLANNDSPSHAFDAFSVQFDCRQQQDERATRSSSQPTVLKLKSSP